MGHTSEQLKTISKEDTVCGVTARYKPHIMVICDDENQARAP